MKLLSYCPVSPAGCHWQNAPPVTSSAVLGGVSWPPEDVTVKLTVRTTVMRTAVVNKFNEEEWRAAAALENELYLSFSYFIQRMSPFFLCLKVLGFFTASISKNTIARIVLNQHEYSL